MATMLNVRMDQEMLSRTEAVAKERGYLSMQEYVRETVRQDIERHVKLKAELDAIIASARKVKPKHMTIEERNLLAKQSVGRKLTPTEKALLKETRKKVSQAKREAKLIWGSAKGKTIKTLSKTERDKLALAITGRSSVKDENGL